MPETIFPEQLVRLTVVADRLLEVQHTVTELQEELDRICTRQNKELNGGEFFDVFNDALTAEARRRIEADDA
jgi:hypothetical protein